MSDAAYTQKKEQYLLKATFVRRKLRSEGYYTILDELESIIKSQGKRISWKQRDEWGISTSAWNNVTDAGVDPLYVFCHPKILNQHPTTLLYYRSVSLLPKKGFSAIINHSPDPYEYGKREPEKIKKQELMDIVCGVNELASNTLEQGKTLTMDELHAMFFAQAGMTIDGSWRNEIGNEGQLLVWNLIARSLFSYKDIVSVVKKNRRGDLELDSIDLKELLDNWGDYRSLNLKNGSTVSYSAEPDLLITSDSGEILCAMEVKAGLDPAGALERTGAVLKSFESVLGEYPDAETILVTSCETDESKIRLNESSAVHVVYTTTDLMTNSSVQRKFITRIRRVAGLLDK